MNKTIFNPISDYSADQPGRISQEPWYLELVSKTNVIFHTDSYDFILPYISSLGINRVFIPPFVQRIDPIVRNTNNTPQQIPTEIITQFPCGIMSLSIKLKNPQALLTELVRTNYVLKLDKGYEALYKDYNNGHKLNLKQATRLGIHVSRSIDIMEFTDFYYQFSHADIPENYKNKKKIFNLVTECLKRRCGFIYKAVNDQNQILACAFLTNYNKRLVYLLSSSSPEGKKQYAMYTILDDIIKTHCNSNLILDFEGSMIPGIAYFMKGFGAEEEKYYVYEWNEHFLCKLKKQLKQFIRR